MAASTSGSRTDDARARGRLHTRPVLWIAGVLLALAIVLPLWVPSYARDTPTLWGFPFFYWYQLLWVFICAALVSVAHQLLLRDERRNREDRDASRRPPPAPGRPGSDPRSTDGTSR